uniref:Cation_ATPase_C domain-containing protein n=1 Tax=Heterorhabditis bacteriophora TaxID=37862 RepID=A0A1I7X7B2_HETBA
MGNVELKSTEYRQFIVIVACINAIVSYLFEKVIVENLIIDYWAK